jgi:hypothetical protein
MLTSFRADPFNIRFNHNLSNTGDAMYEYAVGQPWPLRVHVVHFIQRIQNKTQLITALQQNLNSIPKITCVQTY